MAPHVRPHGALAQKRWNIRAQRERSGLAHIPGDPRREISRVAYGANSPIPKAEPGIRVVCGHMLEAMLLEKSITVI